MKSNECISTLKAHILLGSKGGDPNNPHLEDQGTINISVTTRDAPPNEQGTPS